MPKQDPAGSQPGFCSGEKRPRFLFHIEAQLGLVLDLRLSRGEFEEGELLRR